MECLYFIACFCDAPWLILLAGRYNLSYVVSGGGGGHFTYGLCPQGRVIPLSPSLAVLETVGPNCRNVPSLSPISCFQPLERQVESPRLRLSYACVSADMRCRGTCHFALVLVLLCPSPWAVAAAAASAPMSDP